MKGRNHAVKTTIVMKGRSHALKTTIVDAKGAIVLLKTSCQIKLNAKRGLAFLSIITIVYFRIPSYTIDTCNKSSIVFFQF
jgi:hypothetical protein